VKDLMLCVDDVRNAMEEVLRIMCQGGSVNDAVAMVMPKVKDNACAKEVNDALRSVALGNTAQNNPAVSNYILYVKPRASETLKRNLVSILPIISGGDVDQALSSLVAEMCTSPIDDLPYIVDLARLMSLARYDKSIINDIVCRIRLIINMV
jgi:hypothetical protein